jgi:hypothetical protein
MEECFDAADAFCKNVLAPPSQGEDADSVPWASVEDEMEPLLPPGLESLDVGDLPGLHAAIADAPSLRNSVAGHQQKAGSSSCHQSKKIWR